MALHDVPTEVRALRDRLRRFIDEEVIPAEPVLGRSDAAAGETIARLKARAKAAGLWALGHPKEIGGGGVPFMPFVYLNEVIGRSHWGQVAVGSLSMQDSIMLHLYGTAEQKRRWLEPLVAGDIYPSVGLTEPEAPPHARFSAIVVPTDSPGYEVVRVVPTMGHTGGNHCEIRLTDVRVPRDHLLGGRGEGFVVAQKRLGPGRIFHCMRWLGQAERAFELMCKRATARFAHGSLLAEKGEIQRYVAESAAEIQAARLMTLDAARAMDAGGEARVEIALIKFWGARMLHDVIDRAIQVHGALGVTGDTPLEFMYREARYARIYDGPDEVHRMVVARRLLRDPSRAPWA